MFDIPEVSAAQAIASGFAVSPERLMISVLQGRDTPEVFGKSAFAGSHCLLYGQRVICVNKS
jgi:hypothetical protein